MGKEEKSISHPETRRSYITDPDQEFEIDTWWYENVAAVRYEAEMPRRGMAEMKGTRQ